MDKETAIKHFEYCKESTNDSQLRVTWEALIWIIEQLSLMASQSVKANASEQGEVFVVPKPFISVYRFCEETYFNSTSLYRILRNYTVPEDVLKIIGGNKYVHPLKLIEFCLKKKGTGKLKMSLLRAKEVAKLKGLIHE